MYYTGGNVSIGTSSQLGRLTVFPAFGDGGVQAGIYVRNQDANNQSLAGQFIADSSNGTAIAASATSAVGPTRGISASVVSPNGTAIRGVASANTGTTYGVYGEATSATGWAGYFQGRGHFATYTTVGRTGIINSTEIFGIRHPTTADGSYGGMYVDTAGTRTRPYYGYATAGTSRMYHYYDGDTAKWHVVNGSNHLTLQNNGFFGIGTITPAVRLHVEGGTDTELNGGGFIVTGSTASTNISIDNNEIMARNNGAASTLYLNHAGGPVHIGQGSGGTGILVTPVIQITGGSDFSEMFDVGGEATIEPGMVVVIDSMNPGRLIPSTSAYDRKVAGVVSGAGGVGTGMVMAHDGTIADGEHPVALSGRVYCLVDATESAIESGDMLTTSATPGHAMKAVDLEHAHGAVIGKAMTSLAKGETGLVLVLVNLQ